MTPPSLPALNPAAWQGEAPGRLDMLGGVADYSGALVLQMPIRATTRVMIRPRLSPGLELASEQEGVVTLPSPEPHRLLASTADVATMRAWLDKHQVPRWARYPLGCLLLFCQAWNWRPPDRLGFQVTSEVPISMGVSSSAALEVATLRALETASGHHFGGTELARLAQRVENEIVGAPCGLMDQLASAHGTPGTLLPILCRPDVLGEPVPLPEGVLAVGWPSGVKHAVSGSPYGSARTAAFMGKKILEKRLARRLEHTAELPPSLVCGLGADLLPATLSGGEFLARYGGVDDPLSSIDPERFYPVCAAVEFPIGESFRATLAVHLLRGMGPSHQETTLEAFGELMYQSHAGYSSIGLGSPETDAMVQAVRDRGPRLGFYGARVSGGGCGGTVVVLLQKSALPELRKLAESLFVAHAGPVPLIV
jgi:L-arabinokinase